MEFLSANFIVLFHMKHGVNMVYKIIDIINNDIKTNPKLKILSISQMGVQVNIKVAKLFFAFIMKILVFLQNEIFFATSHGSNLVMG